MTAPKFWLRSKTVMFNLALAAVGSWTMLEASVGHLQGHITQTQYGFLLTVIGLAGFLLRITTSTAIALRAAKAKQP